MVNLFSIFDIDYNINKNSHNYDEILLEPIKELDHVFNCKSLLSYDECLFLMESSKNFVNEAVGINGYLSDYKVGSIIGSYRASFYSNYLAEIIFNRIESLYPKREFLVSKNIDHDNSNWIFSGVNPLFRFIKYNKNGQLIPHYDAPFIKNDNERTLVSLIIYLSNNDLGGSTRFIKDVQSEISCYERNLDDWVNFPSEDEIIKKIQPKIGNGLIFDHRILHDSEKSLDEKIIIRTDLNFKRDIKND